MKCYARVLHTAMGLANWRATSRVQYPCQFGGVGQRPSYLCVNYVTEGETTMATPQLTFNTGQTAILMADFHREGMGDNPMVQERGTVQKARAILGAARQAGVFCCLYRG